MLPQESNDDNEEGDSYYMEYNNPYVSLKEQARIDSWTTYLYYGPYPRDKYEEDGDNDKIKVDEDAIIESIIDHQGYEAQIEGTIDRNEHLKRKSLQHINYDVFFETNGSCNKHPPSNRFHTWYPKKHDKYWYEFCIILGL